MLPIILAVLAWLPAILGFGFLVWVSLNRFAPQVQQDEQLMAVAIPGLGLLSLIANLFNFFLPLTPPVALTVFLLGWGCFLVLAPRFNLTRFRSPAFLIFALILLITLTVSAAKPQFNYESGWYHLQSIRWLTTSKAPFGLANIYGLYTYNSSWFSTLAVMEIPFLEGKSSFVLNPLLLFAYGLDIGLSITRFKDLKQLTFSTVFRLLTVLVWLEHMLGYSLNSATADLAIVFFSLFLITICIRVVEQPENTSYFYLTSILTAAFALTIKLSSFPLLLAPLILLIYQLGKPTWQNLKQHYKNLLVLPLSIASIVLIPWFIRSIIISGCLVYPVQFTCVTALPWTASPRIVTLDMNAIRYWARNAWGSEQLALEGWGWLGHWLEDNFGPNVIFVTALIILVGVAFYWLAARKSPPPAADKRLFALPMSMAVGGIILWFFSAPDPRFGEGYTWAFVLLPLSLGLYRFCLAYQLQHLTRPLMICGGLLAVFLIGLWPLIVPAPWPFSVPWLKNNEALHLKGLELLWQWPAIPEPQLKGTVVDDGLTLFTPIYREQCWNAPVICTPEIYPGLTAYYDSQNRPYMFVLVPQSP